MEYTKLTEQNIDEVIRNYVDYYNNCDNGCCPLKKGLFIKSMQRKFIEDLYMKKCWI